MNNGNQRQTGDGLILIVTENKKKEALKSETKYLQSFFLRFSCNKYIILAQERKARG